MARELIITVEADTSKAHAAFQTLDADIDHVTTTAAKSTDAVTATGKAIGDAEAQAAKLDQTMRQLSGGSLNDAVQAHTALTDAVGKTSGASQELFQWIDRGGRSWSEYASMAKQAWDVLRGITWADIRLGLQGIGEAAGLTVANLGLMGTAGVVLSAAYGGWGIGRMIADFLGLDDAIGRATARLIGFGDLTAQEKGAGQDTIKLAISRGASASSTFADAMKFNEQWVKNMKEGAVEVGNITARQNAPAESAKQIAEWHAEIAKVATAGTLSSLTTDINSHVFSLKDLADRYRVSTGALSLFIKEQHTQKDVLDPMIAVWHEYNSVGESVMDTIDKMSGSTVEAIKYDLQRGESAETLVKVYGVTKEQIRAISEEEKFLASVQAATNKTFGDRIAMIPDLAEFNAQRQEFMHSLPSTDTVKGINSSGNEVNTTVPAFSILPNVTSQNVDMIDAVMGRLKEGRGIVDTLAGSFGNLSKIIIATFTGGGNLVGALRALGTTISDGLFGAGGPLSNITTQLGGLVTKATGFLGDSFSKVFGSAISNILPGIGGLVGPLFDWIKNIGGPSKQELSGRQVEGSFEQSFGGFQKMMDAVGAAYAATGRTAQQAQADVKALIDAEKQGGDAAKEMVDKINLAFNEQKQDAADLDAAIKKYGFTIDELGPKMRKQQLDEQALGLINDWRLLVGAGIEVATVNAKMTQATLDYLNVARRTGAEVPAAMKPVLQSMIDQGVLVDADGKKITDLTGIGVTFSETMTAGFDRVVAKLQQLLEGLGLVPKALDAIPDSKIITIGYGTPMNGTAEEGIPGAQSFAAMGGLVTDQGVQRFAGGGRVLPWPMANGTDTVRALLTPGEMVLNQDQQNVLFGADGGRNTGFNGGILTKYPDGLPPMESVPGYGTGTLPRSGPMADGGGDTFVVTVYVTGDAASVEQFFQRNKVAVARAFNEAVRLNKGGTYTRARGALGLAS